MMHAALCGAVLLPLSEGRLCRRKNGHGDPERRAGDVVNPRIDEEVNGALITAHLQEAIHGDI